MGLFGTDGVRGIAGRELTAELAFGIGRAMAAGLPRDGRVVIGRDTRESSPMLEAALTDGITAAGRAVGLVGLVPTPALAYLIGAAAADAGVMISASHNPPEYNGIKLLDRQGRKWSVRDEQAVDDRLLAGGLGVSSAPRPGRVEHWEETAVLQYQKHLLELFAGRMPDLRVVVDVAHGAAIATAPAVLEQLGLSLTVLHGQPEGRLINQGCGATHPQTVRQAVLAAGADLGLAFDGDADRVMAVDHTGRVVDGDEILYVLATALKSQGALPENLVVATVMTNLGVERALNAQGIGLLRTPVGDRWVADALRERGAALGGEQSGHIILRQLTETGDGLLTALALMAEMARQGRPLADLVNPVQRYPQVLHNVRLLEPLPDWHAITGLDSAIRDAEAALGVHGRVLIRPSGTEPLLRIMLEGRDRTMIDQWADRLRTVVQHALESAKA
ncbi:MAG: phosphoglucosamine mutase [Thermaerobacter sp.]|nr:phosphoglucosamine mutase [Thermaerobacter sp.]